MVAEMLMSRLTEIRVDDEMDAPDPASMRQTKRRQDSHRKKLWLLKC
jgi:hypothetical protein